MKRFIAMVFFFTLVMSTQSQASSLKEWSQEKLKYAQFGVGVFNNSPFSTIRNNKDSKDVVGLTPSFILNARLLKENWAFLPEFNFIPYFKTANNYTKTVTRLGLLGGYSFSDKYMVRSGISFFRTTLSGSGGVVYLNNGTSTSPYYLPKDATESYNTTIDVGQEYAFSENFSVRNDWNIYQMFSSDKRTLGFTLSVHYHL